MSIMCYLTNLDIKSGVLTYMTPHKFLTSYCLIF